MVTELTVKSRIKKILKEHVQNNACMNYNEADTLNMMITPFLNAFGWESNDIKAEVHVTDGNGAHGYIDRTLFIDGEIQVVLEAKRPTCKDLSESINQLSFYFNNSPARVAILTNGIEYWFFSKEKHKTQMDVRPFARIDLQHIEIARRDNFIMRLKKTRFDVHYLELLGHSDFVRRDIYVLLGVSGGSNNSRLAYENFKHIMGEQHLKGKPVDLYDIQDMFAFTKSHSRYNYQNGISEW